MFAIFGRARLALAGLVVFAVAAMPFAPLRAAMPLAGPALSVNAATGRHTISDDIYGVTFFWNDSKTTAANRSFAQAIHLPVNRHGGDATSRYNWQVDSSNAARDWYFTAGNGQANPTPGASVDALIANNQGVGAKSIITIPIINDINGSSPWHCTFPKSIYGDQQSYNPFIKQNGDLCGNGFRASDGKQLVDNNPSATDIANSPSIQGAWVRHLVGKFGSAAHGGVAIYEMDNEPSGWLAMHFDVHPQGVGYTELRDRTLAYAAAVKAADPSAAVLGPGDIPYAAYDCNTCGNDGAAAHGGVPFGEWYLQQMAAYQQQHGVRPLDYYAMHYPGCCGGDQMAQLVDRIHTFHGWVNNVYPGTKLAFDEYNWGDASQFGSALTTAEGLGTFGREGVDLASFWGLDNVNWPTGYAFRMYRNYDGAGSRFGQTAVGASSANAGQLAVFGATRGSDGALTLLVINKTGGALTSPLALSGYAPVATAQVYQYSTANTGAITQGAAIPVTVGGFTATYPANSLTMVVLKPANGASTTATPAATGTMTPGPGTATPTTCPSPSAATMPDASATPCVVATAPTAGNGGGTNGSTPAGTGNGGKSSSTALWLVLGALLCGAGGIFFVLARRRRGQPAIQGDAGAGDGEQGPREHQWNDVGQGWGDGLPTAGNGGGWQGGGSTQWNQATDWDD